MIIDAALKTWPMKNSIDNKKLSIKKSDINLVFMNYL